MFKLNKKNIIEMNRENWEIQREFRKEPYQKRFKELEKMAELWNFE